MPYNDDYSTAKMEWLDNHFAKGKADSGKGASTASNDEDAALDERQMDLSRKIGDYYDAAEKYYKKADEADARDEKRRRTEAAIDAVGGAATGIANAIGGISGGYAFPEGKETTDAAAEEAARARKERKERAQAHFKDQRERLEYMQSEIDRARKERAARRAAQRQAAIDAINAENARSVIDARKSEEEARNRKTESEIQLNKAREGYYNRGRAGGSTSRSSGSGGTRFPPYIEDDL